MQHVSIVPTDFFFLSARRDSSTLRDILLRGPRFLCRLTFESTWKSNANQHQCHLEVHSLLESDVQSCTAFHHSIPSITLSHGVPMCVRVTLYIVEYETAWQQKTNKYKSSCQLLDSGQHISPLSTHSTSLAHFILLYYIPPPSRSPSASISFFVTTHPPIEPSPSAILNNRREKHQDG